MPYAGIYLVIVNVTIYLERGMTQWCITHPWAWAGKHFQTSWTLKCKVSTSFSFQCEEKKNMRVFEIAAIGQTQQKGVSISKDQQEQKNH